MPDKIKSFEDLVNEVNSAKSELEKLCSDTITNIDKQKVKEIQWNLETYRKALTRFESEISQEEKENMTEKINGIESSLAEIDTWIELTEQVPVEPVEDTTEDWKTRKDWIKKARERLKEKGNKIKKNENWERKKALIGLWGVWWVRFVGRQVWKSRIDWYSDMTRKQKRKARKKWKRENREVGDFWERPLWKTLKRGGIFGGAYYLIRWLISWKLGLKDIGEWGLRWKHEKVEESEKQVALYEELSEKEREQYEVIWWKVNDMFEETIWAKEISLGYNNDTQLWRISNNVKFRQWKEPVNYKWLVPYCMDCDAKNIKEILSEWDISEYIFNKDLETFKNKIRSNTRLRDHLYHFAENLQSFQVLGITPWKTKWEKIMEWIDSGNIQERGEELDFFFRQYLKVLTFLKDKQKLLQYKIAEDIISRDWYEKDWKKKNFPTSESDRMKFIKKVFDNDEKRFKENIEKDSTYKKYMESQIKWCYNILVSNWILRAKKTESWNESMTENNQEEKEKPEKISWDLAYRLTRLDDQADDLLQVDDDKTIVDRWIAEFDDNWKLDRTKKDLIELCDDISDDIANERWTGFFQEYFDWLCYAINMEDHNKELIRKQTWLDDSIDKMKKVLDTYKEKIKWWDIKKEDLENLRKTSLDYVAMKKEIEIATFTMTEVKSDATNRFVRGFNTVSMAAARWWKSAYNLLFADGGWEDAVSLITISGVVYLVAKPGKRILLPALQTSKWVLVKWLEWLGWVWWKMTMPSLMLRRNIHNSKLPYINKKSFFLNQVLKWHVGWDDNLFKLAHDEFGIDIKPKIDSMSTDDMKDIIKRSGKVSDSKLNKMSVKDMKKILKKTNPELFERSMPELIQKLLQNDFNTNITLEQAEMLREYRDYKKLRKLMFEQDISQNTTITQRWFHRRSTYTYNIKENNLDDIRDIHKNINRIKCRNNEPFLEWQKFVKKLLRNVKTEWDLTDIYNVSENIIKALGDKSETYCKTLMKFYKRSSDIKKILNEHTIDYNQLDDALAAAKATYYTSKANKAIRGTDDLKHFIEEIISAEKYVESSWVSQADEFMEWINRFRKEFTGLDADEFKKSYKAIKHLLSEFSVWADSGTALFKTINAFKILKTIDEPVEISGTTKKLSKIISEGNIDDILEALNKIKNSWRYSKYTGEIDSLLSTFKSIKNLNKIDEIWEALSAVKKIFKIVSKVF